MEDRRSHRTAAVGRWRTDPMSRNRHHRNTVLLLLALLLIGSATGVLLTNRVDRPREDPGDDTASNVQPDDGEPGEPGEPDEEPVVEPDTKPTPPPKPRAPEAVEPEEKEEPKLSYLELQRLRANESAAVATLRNSISAQAQFQATARADEDGDGIGEYGTFGEMSGGAKVRGTDKVMMPPVLSGAFKKVSHDGVVERSGYRYRIYLPAIGGGWTTEDLDGGLTAGRVDVDGAETQWRLVAWPIEPGKTGRRTFFTDQNGDTWGSPDGDVSTEAPTDRSIPDQDRRRQGPDGSTVSPDGRRWKVVG